jgi:hypothetical protein
VGEGQDVGRKDDGGKLRFDLIPPRAEELIVQVLTYGAKKYAPENWRVVPNAVERYTAAYRRHMNKLAQGEELDPESGLPHLAHAATSLLFLLELPPVVIILGPPGCVCDHPKAMHGPVGCCVILTGSFKTGVGYCPCNLKGQFEYPDGIGRGK